MWIAGDGHKKPDYISHCRSAGYKIVPTCFRTARRPCWLRSRAKPKNETEQNSMPCGNGHCGRRRKMEDMDSLAPLRRCVSLRRTAAVNARHYEQNADPAFA